MLWHQAKTVVAIMLTAGFCLEASADDVVSADDTVVSMLQKRNTLNSPSSVGKRDLVMAYVPYNFGHTLAVNALNSGIKWGDCGQRARDPSECFGQQKPGTPCRLMSTPGYLWPTALAETYFGNKTIFGILRDPYERLVAQFRGSGSYFVPEARAKCDLNEGVKQMVMKYNASKDPYMADCMLLPQAEFFKQPFGATVFVDNRLFPESANKLLEEHGYSDLLIQQNQIEHVSGCDDKWAADLAEDTKELIREVYKDDFKLICDKLHHCDANEAVCLTKVHGMCPEQVFKWDSASGVYLKK